MAKELIPIRLLKEFPFGQFERCMFECKEQLLGGAYPIPIHSGPTYEDKVEAMKSIVRHHFRSGPDNAFGFYCVEDSYTKYIALGSIKDETVFEIDLLIPGQDANGSRSYLYNFQGDSPEIRKILVENGVNKVRTSVVAGSTMEQYVHTRNAAFNDDDNPYETWAGGEMVEQHRYKTNSVTYIVYEHDISYK